jgi:mannose-6-phosphate isomerase
MELLRERSKEKIFESIAAFISEEGFSVVSKDQNRPWGGFFVIDETQAPAFIEKFFSHLNLEDFSGFEKLSPKILVVAPNKRLSWQYHYRRAEIWKLIGGVAGVVISDTDIENTPLPLQIGQVINLKCGERHRLLGADGWGVVAEIWQHTDKENPSNEDDIVRIQDDFGR